MPVADDEGRVCALEFEKFWFGAYARQNSRPACLGRASWGKVSTIREFWLSSLEKKASDYLRHFSVAREIGLKNPSSNRQRRLLGRGSARGYQAFGCRLLPIRLVSPSRPARSGVQLVELPLNARKNNTRLAHRLLPGLRSHC